VMKSTTRLSHNNIDRDFPCIKAMLAEWYSLGVPPENTNSGLLYRNNVRRVDIVCTVPF